MPIKKRVDKSRKLDSYKIDELHYGPGTCLLAGLGYHGPYHKGLRDADLEQDSETILAEMNADWRRYSRTVMDAWHSRDEHALWCAKQQHGDPAQPWAQTEFGDPSHD